MNMSKIVNMEVLGKLALALVILGGINWFTIGFFNKNLVSDSLGQDQEKAKIVYDIVGVAAVFLAIVQIVKASKGLM